MSSFKPEIVIGLNAVIVAVTDEEPKILTVEHGDERLEALPFGPLDPARDRTLELALRGWVRGQTGIEVGYVEQLYTFGDRNRDPRERRGGARQVSIGYLTLARETSTENHRTEWRPCYAYLPWEDWRHGKPMILASQIEPGLESWIDRARADERNHRRDRVDIAFGLGGARWDTYRVLDRYELLYEARLVGEAIRDGVKSKSSSPVDLEAGHSMAFDHRRIVATALGRLRGKIEYRPVVFELLAPTFTLLQLQRVVEALAGKPLHKQNFRRLVERGGLVEGTGVMAAGTVGRPAELFRFRRDVLRERPKPGVGLPGLPTEGMIA